MLDGGAWRLSTHPIRVRNGAANLVANGVILRLTGASDSSEVQVKTGQGAFSVRLADIPYGKSIKALDGRVMFDRVPPTTQLTTSPDEQDYPAAAAGSGEIWTAYLEFKHNADHNRLRANFNVAPTDFSDRTAPAGGDQVFARRYSSGRWDEAVARTSTSGLAR